MSVPISQRARQTYSIVISMDNDDGEQYARWLNKIGHSATVGRDTGNHIDGHWSSASKWANRISNDLWSGFCDQAA